MKNIEITGIQNQGKETEYLEITSSKNRKYELIYNQIKKMVMLYENDWFIDDLKVLSIGYMKTNTVYDWAEKVIEDYETFRIDFKNPDEVKMTNNLKEILNKKGIMQKEIVEVTGLNKSTISNVVARDEVISTTKALIIASFLNMNFEDIFRLKKVKEN